MTILVDEARWPWRGRRWAHLVSDVALDELHEFARRLGKRRLGFQGDHYDVDEIDRRRALELGAVAVTGRELLARLREAGLRRAAPKPRWRRLAHSPPGRAATLLEPALDVDREAGARVGRGVLALGPLVEAGDAAVFVDDTRLVLLVDLAAGRPAGDLHPLVAPVLDPGDELVIGEARADGSRSIELFALRRPSGRAPLA